MVTVEQIVEKLGTRFTLKEYKKSFEGGAKELRELGLEPKKTTRDGAAGTYWQQKEKQTKDEQIKTRMEFFVIQSKAGYSQEEIYEQIRTLESIEPIVDLVENEIQEISDFYFEEYYSRLKRFEIASGKLNKNYIPIIKAILFYSYAELHHQEYLERGNKKQLWERSKAKLNWIDDRDSYAVELLVWWTFNNILPDKEYNQQIYKNMVGRFPRVCEETRKENEDKTLFPE